jgi:metallo-beta-lactamase family protein
MLGSASIELNIEEKGRRKTIVFSGDIGPSGLAYVRDAEPLQRADVVFLESTYGDRDHKPPQETLAEFRAIITDAIRHRAKILVPAFAVGRTQQVLYHLDELFCAGAVKPFPIYLDSPMAIEATKIYQRHPDLFDDETRDMRQACEIAGRRGHVKPSATAAESMALNDVPGPCLIMAGSGMCNAGRILHHLRHNLWRPETVVIIVGFQGEGTLGRQLVDGASQVSIFGEKIAVKARIHTLNGFSAHAGQSELMKWFNHLAPSKPQVVLTHGEARGREPLAALIKKRYRINAQLPVQGDTVRV